MKKKLLLFILSFMFFIPGVSASKIVSELNVDVTLDKTGVATVSETYVMGNQALTYLEKNFKNLNKVTISDIKIKDSEGKEYEEVKDFASGAATYQIIDKGDKKTIKFQAYSKPRDYTITYKVEGMIVNFKDKITGIDWFFIPYNSNQTYNQINIVIKGLKFNKNNTSLYIIGNKNTSYKFDNGNINLYVSNFSKSDQVRLMTNFVNFKFKKVIPNDKKFEEVKKEAEEENVLLDTIKEYLKMDIIKYIGAGLLGILLLSVLIKLIKKTKKFNEYAGIKSFNNVNQIKMEDVEYYDLIPCNGDLYKIAFIAGYYKITKNRADLIGAILLKWLYEGKLRIGYDRNTPYIKLVENQTYERALDIDLNDMLKEASNFNQIDNARLIKYAELHYLRIMTWFNMGFSETISDEVSRGNIKITKKHIILEEKIYNYGKEIMGLKKYLLNFNQVPRSVELTEESYKYLLILAELLGIGKQVGKEILRKNPDNYMAKQLVQLEDVKYIYRNVYNVALNPYKEIVNNKKLKSNYDSELEKLLKQTDSQPERTSKL